MKKAYRILKKEADRQMRARTYTHDEDGRVIIPLMVGDDSEFLSEYTEGDVPTIASDVVDYLEEKTASLPPDQPLTLCVTSCCIDEEEQELYRRAVREHYLVEYIANQKELKRNTVIAASLLVAGILALVTALFIDAQTGSAFWTEMVDIVAWVFVWESVDSFVFVQHELRGIRLRCLSFMDMKITYKTADLPVMERE